MTRRAQANRQRETDGPRPSNPTRGKEVVRRSCRICRAENREVIEAILLNGDTYEANARLVSAEYGLKVSGYTVKNHLLNHALSLRAQQTGILLREVVDEDGPVLTAKGIHKLLLKEAFQKVATGEASVKTMNDVLRILELDISMRRTEKRVQESQENDEGMVAMQQLGYIIQSLYETLPEEHYSRAMTRAISLGLDEGLLP